MVNVYKTGQEADGLAERADVLRCRGEVDLAEEAARNGLKSFPKNVGLTIALGRVMLATGRYDKALAEFGQAIGWAPDDPLPVAWRIATLSRRCDFPVAFAEGEKALNAFPLNIQIRVAVARVYMDASRPQDAITLLEEAVRMAPGDRGAVLWRAACRAMLYEWPDAVSSAKDAVQMEEAERDARDALRRYSLAKAYCGMGRVLVAGQQYGQALGYLADAIEADLGYPKPWEWRISALRGLYLYDEAEQTVTEALKLARGEFRDDPYLLTVAGWMHGDRDQYPAALEKFDQALRRCPTHLDALQWKTVVLRCLMDPTRAMAAAQHAIGLRPEDAELVIELGRTHEARSAFTEALGQYDAVLGGDPGNVDALVAKSSALRSLRRNRDAEREVGQAWGQKRTNRDLMAERGWIQYDQRNLTDARTIFENLLATAVNNRERALASYGLGWVAFVGRDYITAATRFSAAIDEKCGWPDNLSYRLGLAWALAKRDGRPELWDQAEDIARHVADTRPDPVAHVCLGFIGYRRDDLASAEYHLTRALEIDPQHGSYTDLGAFYLHTARYPEAQDTLAKAIARDWHDVVAHVEMGCLHWALGDGHLADAEYEFRQARAIDPGSVRATTGLARTLVMQGKDVEAEKVLREALLRIDGRKKWRVHLVLARLLARQGTAQQDEALLAEAFDYAKKAINGAPEESEPQVVAGVVQFHWASLIHEPVRREDHYRQARKFLKAAYHERYGGRSPRADRAESEAMRYLAALKGERSRIEPALWGGILLASISLGVLLVMWTMFFATDKISDTLITVNTPVLVGLIGISALLPALIRLKVPGMEANLQPSYATEIVGPSGDDSFGPGRLSVPVGPAGQIPQLGEGRLQHAKNTRHSAQLCRTHR